MVPVHYGTYRHKNQFMTLNSNDFQKEANHAVKGNILLILFLL